MAPKATKKELIKEIIRCGSDPLYFTNRYARIQHPVRGLIPFNTYHYQDDIIDSFTKHRFNIVLKARQLGLSTITGAFIAWYILLHRDKNVLVVATKLDTAKNVIRMIKNIFKYLPKWLKDVGKITIDNRHSIELANGSRVKAVTTSSDVGRSEAVSLLVVDEVAHIKGFDEIWTGLWPTLSTGGSAILLSTPNGTGNFFHQQYAQAQSGENNFNCRFGTYINPHNSLEMYDDRLMWWVHPDHDENWFITETAGKSPREIAQEYLCFGAGTKVFTRNGWKNIESLKVGDLVLTHRGRFRKVLFANKRVSETGIVKFKTFFNRTPTSVTHEHPILSEKSGWVEAKDFSEKDMVCALPKNIAWPDNKKKIDLLEAIEPDFFKLKVCDDDSSLVYLNDRRHKSVHRRFVDVDYSLGYFIGLYLAEGFVAKNSINFSFNYPDELETCVKKLKICLDYIKGGDSNCKIYSNKKSGSFVVNSAILSKLIKLFVSGGLAHNKRLSDYAYSIANKDFFRGILDGVFDGDGCLKDVYDKQIALTSKNLIYDIKFALSVLGLGRTSIRKSRSGGVATILGREVQVKDAFVLKVLKSRNQSVHSICELLDRKYINESSSHKNSHRENDNYFLSKIVEKEEISAPTEVYNIEVEEDNSFVTEHFVAHNCAFNASGDTFIWHEDIAKVEQYVKEPRKLFPLDRNIWIWDEPSPNGTYLISVDISRGDAQDYSAFHVLRLDTAQIVQVAEYKGKVKPDLLGTYLVSVAQYYNNATIAPENNSGWSGQTILKIQESNYPYLHYSRQRKPKVKTDRMVDPYMAERRNDYLPGYAVTSANRLQMLAKVEQYVRQGDLIINSPRTVAEFKTFIVDEFNKPIAQRGYSDDLIMALAGGLWVRDQAYIHSYRDNEVTQAMMGAMTVSNTQTKQYRDFNFNSSIYDRSRIQQHVENQNKIVMANGEEVDLNWLITSG